MEGKKLSQHTVNLLIICIILIGLIVNILLANFGIVLTDYNLFGYSVPSQFVIDAMLPLRVGLSFVFLWYSIDNFFNPDIFNNMLNLMLKKMGLEENKRNFKPWGYFQCGIEFIVGILLVTGLYLDIGSLLASFLLFAILFAYEEGTGALLVRDVGLLGGSIALFLLTAGLVR